MTRNRPKRRGLAIIPALVCLVLVTIFCGALMRQVTTHRGALRDEERRMQAEWLAESGAARAAARLTADHAYEGETWNVSAADLGGEAAAVNIVVEPIADQPTRRLIRVEADFPHADERRARSSKTLTVDFGIERPGGRS